MCVITFGAPGSHHLSLCCSDIYNTMWISKLARVKVSYNCSRHMSFRHIISNNTRNMWALAIILKSLQPCPPEPPELSLSPHQSAVFWAWCLVTCLCPLIANSKDSISFIIAYLNYSVWLRYLRCLRAPTYVISVLEMSLYFNQLSLVLNHINYYTVALIRRLMDISARECIDTKQSISFLNSSAAHVWHVLFFFCIAHWWQEDMIKPQ